MENNSIKFEVVSKEVYDKWLEDNSAMAEKLYDTINSEIDEAKKDEIAKGWDDLMTHYSYQPWSEDGSFMIIDYFGLSYKLEEIFEGDKTWGGRRKVFELEGTNLSDEELDEYISSIKKKFK